MIDEYTPSDQGILERYRRRYRRQDKAIAAFDAVLRLFVPRHAPSAAPGNPRRILLANAGHLGDAIMSTSLLPVLKHAFPEASIGFLTGGYSRSIIDGHPLIAQAHYVDHWVNSRAKKSKAAKLAAYHLRDAPALLRELRAANYDVAIDLHAWLPNYIPLLWRARIPTRVGFSRMGFAPLLTHAIEYGYDRRHEVDHFVDLLKPWQLPPATLALARPQIAPVQAADRMRVISSLCAAGRYRVLHPASSTPTKDWTLDGWASLARKVADEGLTPVITGAGARDASMAAQIVAVEPRAVDAVNKLPWHDLMALLSGAEVVYSVDTAIGHAAAALGRPVVVLYGGMADPQHWSPHGAAIVTHPVPCSPCFDKRGCAHRACLLESTLQDVEAQTLHALSPR